MLRIHFLPEDLARTHVAANVDALWETVLSLQLLHNHDGRLVFRHWRREVRPRAPRSVRAILLSLSPPRGDFADLLTPATGTLGLDAGLESVRATPLRLIRRDLDHLAVRQRLPSWSSPLADGEPQALNHVVQALRTWHDTAVRPYHDQITTHLDADRAIRLRDARLGGPERVLAGLPPPLDWQPPVLLSPYPEDHDLYLDGRGLILLPAFFCWGKPVTLINPHLPPVLVYPVERDLDWLNPHSTSTTYGDRAIAALIGSTRAAVLDTVGQGPVSTTEVAKRLRICPSSASEHATTLREAGLIVTRRAGNAVLHSLTPTGVALLDGPRGSVSISPL
ncbi:ArsR/SmtB family transcription factor [Micromonospora sp. NPDC050417]|uniref:ArsR/SmtB family transcription factor n=1 Tax=Micromonospora sp. NPDC050417 TaxID=3364280 RepID=UPI003798418D